MNTASIILGSLIAVACSPFIVAHIYDNWNSIPPTFVGSTPDSHYCDHEYTDIECELCPVCNEQAELRNINR